MRQRARELRAAGDRARSRHRPHALGSDPRTEPEPEPEPTAPGCVDRCDGDGPVPGSSPECYCDELCLEYDDCCSDYTATCG